MSVQDLSSLHSRYVGLSSRFKAAWTYHQFLQGLKKVFVDEPLGDYDADFQSFYAALKEISEHLGSADGRVEDLLVELAARMDGLLAVLAEQDSKVAPSALRRFFQRVKNYDEKILAQLVRFYLYTQEGDDWEPRRVDRADFLLTKLVGENEGVGGDRGRLAELLGGFWSLAERPADGQATEAARARCEETRRAAAATGDLEQMHEKRLIETYRAFKHRLGWLLFEPSVTLAVAETNLALRQAIRDFYQQEERRIFADYQRISDLERDTQLDATLDQELSDFHGEVQRFEQALQEENVRLEEVSRIRHRVRSLMPRLAQDSSVGETSAPLAGGARSPLDPEVSLLGWAGSAESEQLLREQLGELVKALEGADPAAPPRNVTLSHELYPFRLEPREVVAYRRLLGEPTCDQHLERFVLESAALRRRINLEAEEINGLLDDSAISRESPLFEQARRTTQLADAYVRQLEHAIERALMSGDLAEAQAFHILRMRLVRDYSGLWLLTHRSP